MNQPGRDPFRAVSCVYNTITMQMTGKPSSRSRLLRVLLGLFAAIAIGAGFRWWQVHQRMTWLESASVEELASHANDSPDDVALFEHLGARALHAEQWPRAARAYQRACELAPDRVGNWVGWARSIYAFGGFRAADAILTDFVQKHPADSVGYMERAALRRLAKRPDIAWQDADKATKLDPRSGQAWALRGDLSLDQGIYGEGEKSFLRAHALMPDSPWPAVGLYQTYVYEKKYDEAEKAARLVVDRFPNVKEGKLYLGEALILTANSPQDYEAARALLFAAADFSDTLRKMDRSAVQFLLGKSYFNQSRWREAIAHFEQADKIAPGNPDLLFLLGRAYRKAGDEVRATATMARHRQVYELTAKIRQYSARINDDPDNGKIRLEYARWNVKNGMPANAVIQYEEMISRGVEVDAARRELRALEESDAIP